MDPGYGVWILGGTACGSGGTACGSLGDGFGKPCGRGTQVAGGGPEQAPGFGFGSGRNP